MMMMIGKMMVMTMMIMVLMVFDKIDVGFNSFAIAMPGITLSQSVTNLGIELLSQLQK